MRIPFPRPAIRLVPALLLPALAACTALPPPARDAVDADSPYREPTDFSARDLDVHVSDEEIVRDASGRTALRLRFSFVSHRGYVSEDDVHRSSGLLWLPADDAGQPRFAQAVALVTEQPPGFSLSRFPLHDEYGLRTATELGVPSAVVDLRGPVVSDLRSFGNPDDAAGGSFTSEDQFAYSMLRSYQESGDVELLWEERISRAWMRSLSAVSQLVRDRTGDDGMRFLVAGQDWGAAGAVRAAALDDRIHGVVAAGRPYDWMDHHFVTWRRWERRSAHFPLGEIQPSIWSSSRDVLSFLSSTWGNPDPGCPTCAGNGRRWRNGYDVSQLRSEGRLPVGLFYVVGDSDPDLPIDGLARASAPAEVLAELPGTPGFHGPFAEERLGLPVDDVCVLPDAPSTLSHPEAASAVRGWTQHLAGYRDLPWIRIEETFRDGDLLVVVRVGEGNAPVTGVTLRFVETGAVDPFDFKAPLRRRVPQPMGWRDVSLLYSGPERDLRSRWEARLPWMTGANQAYWVRVETRVGETVMGHSLPIRPLWHRGDPAAGPARP